MRRDIRDASDSRNGVAITSRAFARSILTNDHRDDRALPALVVPASRVQTDNASNLLLAWAAEFSPKCAIALQTLQLNEAGSQLGESIKQFADSLREAEWDPSKHPRLGRPPNAGWWANRGGGSILIGRSDAAAANTIGIGNFVSPSMKTRSAAPQGGSTGSARLARAPSHSARAGKHVRQRATTVSAKGGELNDGDVRTYFTLLYGEKGRSLLRAFEKSGGALKLDRLWFANSALDDRDHWGPHQIRLHKDLNPVEAAQELMNQLISASGMTEVRQHLDHTGFSNIERLIDSYRQSVKSAAQRVALATELYLSGMTIANEGADWVITVHEVSEGNYYALAGLLPFLPATVGKTGVILKHGDQSLRVTGATIRSIKALPIDELISLLESTRKLARNMEKAGINRPAGTAAHHIVPAGIKKFDSAIRARDHLQKLGISLENAANGVYLPSQFDNAVKAAYHGSLHSRKYCNELLRRRQKAKTQEHALLILNDIRADLLQGTFPY